MSTPYSPYDPSQQQPGMTPPQGGYGPYPPPPGGYAPYPPQGGYDPSGPRGYLQGGPVGFGAAISEAFRNILNFQGRASRSAYWWFALFMAIIAIPVMFVVLSAGSSALKYLADLVFFVLGLGLTVRRLHDQDKSGLWYLIVLVPLIGGIWLFVLTLLPGTRGPNRFG